MSEDACMSSSTNPSSPPYLLQPSNTHISTAHGVIYIQRCGSFRLRCGSLPDHSGTFMPPTGSDSIRHDSRVTSSNVKSDFQCCSVILPFVSTTANYFAHFVLLKLTLYVFLKAYNIPLFTI